MKSFNRTPYAVYLFCTFINFLGEWRGDFNNYCLGVRSISQVSIY